ncbi:MAG TPA: DUF4127 domain-containing protein [Desulfotomaculum sp.]|nr:MAG: hypothetical protein JL56_07150 [Desulfotomaculum sp. BICA1-6]HBX23654.1 DUF4127 domain-containing protein [Desulfotomaculum sp.]
MKVLNKALPRVFLLCLSILLLTGCNYSASAEPSGHILYLPLDDRPVNYANTIELADLTGRDVKIPATAQLKSQPELTGWLQANSSGAKAAVISLDMLVYGGLVESRKHQLAVDELYSQLSLMKELKLNGPALVFTSIMRTPAANTQYTMPDYFAEYGTHIYKYGVLQDKLNSGASEPGDKEKLAQLAKTIPVAYLEDFTARRDKNHQVTAEVLKLVQQGFIDYLVVGSDDTSPYGFSRAEKEKLISLAGRYGVTEKVIFFPGTDECGMLLLAATVNKVNGDSPAVFVDYAQASGAGSVQPYEDIPLDENVQRHILAAGGSLAQSAEEAEIVLAVNNRPAAAGEAAAQGDEGEYIAFVNRIEDYLRANKPVMVADVRYANGGDPAFLRELNRATDLSSLAGYAGWNTAGNSIGLALSQGLLYITGECSGIPSSKEQHHGVLLTRLIEDWGYQVEVRPKIKKLTPENQQQLFTDAALESEITQVIEDRLNVFTRDNLAEFGDVSVTGVKLPWHRLFDVEFQTRSS